MSNRPVQSAKFAKVRTVRWPMILPVVPQGEGGNSASVMGNQTLVPAWDDDRAKALQGVPAGLNKRKRHEVPRGGNSPAQASRPPGLFVFLTVALGWQSHCHPGATRTTVDCRPNARDVHSQTW